MGDGRGGGVYRATGRGGGGGRANTQKDKAQGPCPCMQWDLTESMGRPSGGDRTVWPKGPHAGGPRGMGTDYPSVSCCVHTVSTEVRCTGCIL